MALYDSYLDEDVLDETSGESYLDEDYDEAAENFDEAGYDDLIQRRRRQRSRALQARQRGGSGWRRYRPGNNGQPAIPPVTKTNIRRAFGNVEGDVNILQRKLKFTENAQSTAFGVDILGSALLAPKIVVDTDPNNPTKLKIQDNLLPLIGIKLIGNMIGPGNKLDFRKVLPWILAALVLSPGSLQQLGINVGNRNSAGTPGSFLGNLDTTTLLLLGAILYFAVAKK